MENNMPYYTSLEKQSMYQMICGASLADGKRDYNETNLINEISREFGLTDEEREKSRSLNNDIMLSTLRSMSYEKKMYLSSFICQVIIADGKIDPREETFFNYYRQILNLPIVE